MINRLDERVAELNVLKREILTETVELLRRKKTIKKGLE